jgi:phospholipid/cholesterol/gamma-HCH transport system permease protein
VKVLESIGNALLRTLGELGRFVDLLFRTAAWTVRPPYDIPELVKQMVRVGVDSIPVVFLTGLFTGMVIALQTYTGFARFHAESFVGSVVALSVTRELAPVLAALMVTGRVGSAMAAELGTMRVTEQIDALTTLATNPIKYLVVPRLIAAVISMPILVAIADSIGIFGGYVVATQSLGFTGSIYLKNTIDFVTNQDIYSGLIKATVFGFIIALMGCYNGFHSKGGAQGVGSATTNAVVSASILILAANYILTSALFTK